jgi:uncharacterized membrane protein YbaN (DUF454 family)
MKRADASAQPGERCTGGRGDAPGTGHEIVLKSPLRIVWVAGGTLSVAIGIAGLVLPLVPTTPFVILAAWCFARSSPKLRERLVSSRLLGPSLRDWQRERAIARRVKLYASAMMASLVILSASLHLPFWIIILQVLAGAGAMIFLWTRPDARHRADDWPKL